MLYGGKLLLRAPRARPAPNAMQIAPTTANPIYSGQSEPAISTKSSIPQMVEGSTAHHYPKTNNEHNDGTSTIPMKRSIREGAKPIE